MPQPWRLALCLLLPLGACTKWEVQNVSPEQAVASEPKRAFLVKRKDGSQVQLREAGIVSDSLVGIVLDDPNGPSVRQRCAIALTDVQSIAVRTKDRAGNTVLLVILGAMVAVSVLAGLSLQGE